MREIDPTAAEWITSGYIANSKDGKKKYDPASIFAAVAPSVIGGLLGGSSSSGTQQGGTATASKDPWLAAQPWMKANLETGQNLQNYYQKNPFNQQQQASYGNLASGTDFINKMTPGLLQQFSQPQSFDRSNPSRMPNPLNFGGGSDPIANAYKDILGTTADPEGYAHQQNALNNGMSIGTIRANLASSPNGMNRSRLGMNVADPSMYGGMMNPSMPVQGNMNMTQNPFGNGGIAPTPTAPQVAPQDIQKMIDDALKAQQNSGWSSINSSSGGDN